eukprot:645555-Prorocentrum_minimum.AAC.1
MSRFSSLTPPAPPPCRPPSSAATNDERNFFSRFVLGLFSRFCSLTTAPPSPTPSCAASDEEKDFDVVGRFTPKTRLTTNWTGLDKIPGLPQDTTSPDGGAQSARSATTPRSSRKGSGKGGKGGSAALDFEREEPLRRSGSGGLLPKRCGYLS